jgi:hypothetical protein
MIPAIFCDRDARATWRAGPARRDPKTMRARDAGSSGSNFTGSSTGLGGVAAG